MSLVNYLGTYETLDQVWEAYPEGGKEGDYLYIASVLKKWNKYTSAWADPTEEDVEGSTIVSLEEDVVVGSSTLINYLGRFETLEDALNAYPEGGNEGDYIYVGDDIYAWDKYANEWVVSLDAPLEVAISEEDIIPNSNTFINYLGGFVDRDAVWQKYPEGGKVGDYLYIASDLHIWDKYICNWVAATPPDESSQIRPIEVLTQEGVVEYSENYINYLGVFESIEQAWEAYPEGGKEGDYIIVGGEQLRWNKYTSNWGEYDPDASTPARPVATIYGDLHVHNDVVIGEDLYARILETFTTKKWVLEQGYISLDDVTSELVMSKIVPDDTTIEVRDGKLVVIGGGGGGTADSVAWDNITGKPDWIGDTKPTYTLDEIAGSNGDGFVTLKNYQIIEGVKNFAKGIQFEGLPMYRSKDDTVYLDANLVVRGGVTMYGSNLTTSPSIFEALPIDNDTIKRNAKGELYAVGGGGSGTGGGGVADSVAWSNVTNKPTWITDTKPKYSYSEILDTPDLSVKADKATTLAGYGITNAYTKSEVNNIIDSLDDTYVTIAGEEQSITAEHNFVNGFKVGGLPIKKSQDKTLYLDANLAVSGAITMYGSDSTTFPTIWANIPFNLEHMSWDGSQWSVVGSSGSGSGLDYDMLDDYLTINGYAKQDWVTGREYITSAGSITGNSATATKLQTARSLWGRTFDGSQDLTGSLTVTTGEGYRINYNGYDLRFIISGSSANRGIWDNTNNNWLMYRSGSNDIYFTSGNIGFGTTSPTEKVTVNGNVKSTGHFNSTSANSHYLVNGKEVIGSYKANYYICDSAAVDGYRTHLVGKSIAFQTSTSKVTNALLDESGNFSITGVLKLPAVDSGFVNPRITFGDTKVRIGATTAGLLGVYASGDIRINPNSATSANSAMGLWLKATGLNGVNNSSPTEALDVVGNILASGTMRLSTLGSNAFNNAQLFFGANDARIGVNSSGTMAFYARAFLLRPASSATGGSSIGITIDTSSNILTTGGITMNYSSDRRLKQNIRKVDASKVLMSLGGVYQYEYLDSEVQKNHIYEGTHYGLIYQHVKGTKLDKMCYEREDKMGALNYISTDFISIVAGATMENISEIEKLKRENRRLKKRVEQLEKRVA